MPEQKSAPEASLSPQAIDLALDFQPYSRAVPVLSFSSDGDGVVVPLPGPSEFAAQMAILAEAGFSTVSIEQVRAVSMGDDVDLPVNPILLTFDGSSTRLWVDVDPILKAFGFSAAVYLTEDDLVDPDDATQLNLDTLRTMRDSGRWEFGSHYSATDLARPQGESLAVWENRVRTILLSGKLKVEDFLNRRPISMSYPYHDSGLPRTDPAVARRLPELVGEQFDLGFLDTTSETVVTVEIDKTLAPRIPQSRTALSPEALLGAIDDSIPRPPVSEVDSISWSVIGDGTCDYSERTLVISTEGTTSCRLESQLQNSWEDIALSGIVDGVENGIAATFRLRELALDRIEVALTSTEIVLQQQVDGVWRPLGRAPLAPTERGGPQPMLIELRGSLIQVTVAGRLALESEVGPSKGPGRLTVSAVVDDLGVLAMTQFVVSSAAVA